MNHCFYILSVGKSGTNGIGNAYNAAGEVNIISDFDVDLGSEFEIKYP